jgi:hypothetical protein
MRGVRPSWSLRGKSTDMEKVWVREDDEEMSAKKKKKRKKGEPFSSISKGKGWARRSFSLLMSPTEHALKRSETMIFEREKVKRGKR